MTENTSAKMNAPKMQIVRKQRYTLPLEGDANTKGAWYLFTIILIYVTNFNQQIPNLID